jgi:hypothetical protein
VPLYALGTQTFGIPCELMPQVVSFADAHGLVQAFSSPHVPTTQSVLVLPPAHGSPICPGLGRQTVTAGFATLPPSMQNVPAYGEQSDPGPQVGRQLPASPVCAQ